MGVTLGVVVIVLVASAASDRMMLVPSLHRHRPRQSILPLKTL
jgi:hypothetical protein